MKILCSKSRYDSDMDFLYSLIGKPAWVLVSYVEDMDPKFFWVKLLDVRRTWIVCHAFRVVDYDYNHLFKVEPNFHLYIPDLKLARPVELCTNAEMEERTKGQWNDRILDKVFHGTSDSMWWSSV